MNAPLLASLLLVAATALAQTDKAVEITAEPHHHLAWQNEYFRAFKVEVAPGEATLLHIHHHDYVFVIIGPAEIVNEAQGKPPAKVHLEDGQTKYSAPTVHLVRNAGDAPFRNVAIEFLKDKEMKTSNPQDSNDEGTTKTLQNGTQKILFVRDGVRVSSVELQPQGALTLDEHSHGQLLIAVSALQLKGKTSTEKMKIEDLKWIDAGKKTLTNAGDHSGTFVMLEVL